MSGPGNNHDVPAVPVAMSTEPESLTLRTAEERELWGEKRDLFLARCRRGLFLKHAHSFADEAVRAYRERCAPTYDAPDVVVEPRLDGFARHKWIERNWHHYTSREGGSDRPRARCEEMAACEFDRRVRAASHPAEEPGAMTGREFLEAAAKTGIFTAETCQRIRDDLGHGEPDTSGAPGCSCDWDHSGHLSVRMPSAACPVDGHAEWDERDLPNEDRQPVEPPTGPGCIERGGEFWWLAGEPVKVRWTPACGLEVLTMGARSWCRVLGGKWGGPCLQGSADAFDWKAESAILERQLDTCRERKRDTAAEVERLTRERDDALATSADTRKHITSALGWRGEYTDDDLAAGVESAVLTVDKLDATQARLDKLIGAVSGAALDLSVLREGAEREGVTAAVADGLRGVRARLCAALSTAKGEP